MIKNILLSTILCILTVNLFSQSLSETKEWLSNKLKYHYCFKRLFQGVNEEYSYDIKVGFNEKTNVLIIYQSNLLDYTSNNDFSKSKTNNVIEIKLNDINLSKFKYETYKCESDNNSCWTSLALRFTIYANHIESIKWTNKTKNTVTISEFPDFWFDIPTYVDTENKDLGERLIKAFHHLCELSGSKKEAF